MKANELKTGSIISISDKLQVVTQITSEPFSGITTRALDGHKGYNCSLGDSSVEPVKLTEEWLLKFGFHKGNQFPYIDGATGWFCLDENSGYYKLALPSDNIGNQFQFVHQLQNLYFGLTGEELKLNQ